MISDRWQGLELRHLVALKAIAETGTFAGAAARLGYTQSAISQQVAALERVVGASLIERAAGRRPPGLTTAGELVLRHGEAIIARAQAAQADVSAAAAGAAGPLRVGTYPSVGAKILPELLPRFAAECPDLEVQLQESNSDAELLSLVERGLLDLTFCMLPLADGPFDAVQLLLDPWVLLLPADGRRPKDGSSAYSLLCFRTCPVITEIESLLRRRGVEPKIVFRSDDNATLQGLVAAGFGAAFMPCLTLDVDDERTVFVDVRAKLPPRRIGIAWHRDRFRSPASHAFVEEAATVARQLESQIAPASFA